MYSTTGSHDVMAQRNGRLQVAAKCRIRRGVDEEEKKEQEEEEKQEKEEEETLGRRRVR